LHILKKLVEKRKKRKVCSSQGVNANRTKRTKISYHLNYPKEINKVQNKYSLQKGDT